MLLELHHLHQRHYQLIFDKLNKSFHSSDEVESQEHQGLLTVLSGLIVTLQTFR